MFKPLLRTIPTLSGNVKLACTLTDYKQKNENEFHTNVRYAQFLPLSSQMHQYRIDAKLIGSSYEQDLKKFYEKYSEIFFDPDFKYNKNDMMEIDKSSSINIRNTDFEFGVKRVSYMKSGCEYACFAPIYVESIEDLPDSFEIEVKIILSQNFVKTKKIVVEISKEDSINYLDNYLKRYLSRIDDNVAFVNNLEKTVTYYGIDLINGGFVSKVDSTVVKALFNNQMPMQLFDSILTHGFERNSMCIKQIVPLAFYFDIEQILNDYERKNYIGKQLEFNCHYIKNHIAVDMYDFDFNYDHASEQILKANDINGELNWFDGNISNLMDISFPSLLESRLYDFQFSNKLTTTFNRWKLKYSDDEHPYVTNMSWVYSKNQDNNYKYREFPVSFASMSGLCNYIVDEDGNYRYNMLLPIGNGKDAYDKYSPLSTIKYFNILNNYCFNWFDVLENNDIITVSSWVDVKDDKAYFNGILYNLNNIYDESNKNVERIDKFGVFAYINTDNLKETKMMNNLKISDYSISETFTTNNCSINDISTSDIESLYLHNEDNTHFVEANQIFVENQYGKYVELSYISCEKDYYDLTAAYIYEGDLVSYSYSCVNSMYANNTSAILYNISSYAAKDGISWSETSISEYIVSDSINALLDNYGMSIRGFGNLGYVRIDLNYSNCLAYESTYINVFDNDAQINESLYINDGGEIKKSYDGNVLTINNEDKNTKYKNSIYQRHWMIDYGMLNSIGKFNMTDIDIESNIDNGYLSSITDRYATTDLKTVKSNTWLLKYCMKFIMPFFIESIKDYIESTVRSKYTFMPIMVDNELQYSTNTYVRRYETIGDRYENETLAENINKDFDVIYVLKYNMKAVLNKYVQQSENIGYGDSFFIEGWKEDASKSRNFYAKFLNKNHLSLYYTELCKDENYQMLENWENTWYDNVYIQTKILTIPNENGLDVKYVYTPISKYDEFKNFSNFMKSIEYNPNNKCFSFNQTEDLENILEIFSLNDNNFNICFNDDFVRLNKEMFEAIHIEDKSKYRDLYIYRPLTPAEYDEHFYSIRANGLDPLNKSILYSKNGGSESHEIPEQPAEDTICPDNQMWYTTTDNNQLSISLPSGCTHTFVNNKGILQFDDSALMTINANIFKNQSTLKTFTCNYVATNNNYVYESAFENCTSLKIVRLPSTISMIKQNAFKNCSNLVHIEMPLDLKTINKNAFENCTSISIVLLKNRIEMIDDYAFKGCANLESINFPDTIIRLGQYAFSGTKLKSIKLGAHISTLYSTTFDSSAVQSIVISKENSAFDDGGYVGSNCICAKNTHRLIFGCVNSHIPASCETIGEYAFANCSGLTSIHIPNNVSIIESNAFENCTGLVSIEIPSAMNDNTTAYIYSNAFKGCSSLTSISVHYDGNTPFNISDSAFNNIASIGTLYIGPDVSPNVISSFMLPNEWTISKNVNDTDDCIIFYTNDPLSSTEDIINSQHVEDSSGDTLTPTVELISIPQHKYKASFTKNGKRTKVYKIIGGLFKPSYRNYIESVELPRSLTCLGGPVFYNCESLHSITMYDKLITIYDNSNTGCFGETGLTNIELPNSLKYMYGSVFANSNIGSCLIIPGSVTTIYSSNTGMFYNCNPLDTIIFSEGIETIGDGILNGITKANNTSGILNIIFPSTLNDIGSLYSTPIIFEPDHDHWLRLSFLSHYCPFNNSEPLLDNISCANDNYPIVYCPDDGESYGEYFPAESHHPLIPITKQTYIEIECTVITNTYERFDEFDIVYNFYENTTSILHSNIQYDYLDTDSGRAYCFAQFDYNSNVRKNIEFCFNNNDERTSTILSIIIPDTVYNINDPFFTYFDNLHSLDIYSENFVKDKDGDKLRKIDDNHLYKLYSCAPIGIDDLIELDASYNTDLQYVVNDTITSFNRKFLDASSNLKALVIDKDVDAYLYHKPDYIFENNGNLEYICVETGNSKMHTPYCCNCILEKNSGSSSEILLLGFKHSFIPHTITTIESNAFSHITLVDDVIIPYNVHTIEDEAFYACSINNVIFQDKVSLSNGILCDINSFSANSINKLIINKSFNYLNRSSFAGNEDLHEIYLGTKVDEFTIFSDEDSPFYSCNHVTKVVLEIDPENDNRIKNFRTHMFGTGGQLTEIYVYGTSKIETIDDDFIYNTGCIIYVDKSLLDYYRSSFTDWHFEKISSGGMSTEEPISETYMHDVDNCLECMFNEIYVEDMNQSVLHLNYTIDNISEVKFGNAINYRYNKNNTLMMIQLNDNQLTNIKAKYPSIKTYASYSSTNKSSLINDPNHKSCHRDIEGYNYDKTKINIYKDNDGTVYGYYLIENMIDNTMLTFNLKSFIDDTESEYVDNMMIRAIEYINGTNIIENPSYVAKIYKEISPMMYVYPLSALGELNTIMKPATFNLNIIYKENLLDNTNGSNEMKLEINKNSKDKILLSRYTDSISPILRKKTLLNDMYFLKYKNIHSQILDTGKFNSINDSVIYRKNVSINEYPGCQIYSITDSNIKGYIEPVETYVPIEYKYYNASRMTYLPSYIEISLSFAKDYETILEYESFEHTFEAFSKYIDKDCKYSNDEILFLYNRYDIEYDTTPIRLSLGNKNKLYNLTYKFRLY